jgi:hypothetical protein
MISDGRRGPGVWRRRRRPLATTAAAVAVAAALAVALWLGHSPANRAGGQVAGRVYTTDPRPAPAAPVGWSATADGRKPGPQNASDFPQFDVQPGQRLTITVTIQVPGHVAMTQLFIGITTRDSSGVGPRGPIGMKPILKTAEHVPPGQHQFTLHWTVPAGTAARAGYDLSMAQFWPKAAQEPQAYEGPEDAIAVAS